MKPTWIIEPYYRSIKKGKNSTAFRENGAENIGNLLDCIPTA